MKLTKPWQDSLKATVRKTFSSLKNKFVPFNFFNLTFHQMRAQEAEFKKNKAVLEQRIEILELQNRELKEREENLKKMNNSIFGALKDFNKEGDPSHVNFFININNSWREKLSRSLKHQKNKLWKSMESIE